MDEEHLSEFFLRFRSRGDAAALAEVFDRSAPALLRVARHLCGDEVEAEDALQATFQTVIEKAAAWDATRPLFPWMGGILSMHARRARERAERRIENERLPDRPAADPSALAANRELGLIVEETIASLPETYAPALRGRLLEGKSVREIARSLGLSANATSVRLHRGLELLRRALPAGAALGAAGTLLPAVRPRGLKAIRRRVLLSARGGAGAVAEAARLSWPAALTSKTGIAAAALVVAAGAVGVSGVLGGHGSSREAGEAAERPTLVRPPAVAVSTRKTERPAIETRRGSATPPGNAERKRFAVAQEPDPEAWLERFRSAQDWRAALAIAGEIADLAPDDALRVMQAIYRRIPHVAYRQQVLKPFVFHGGNIHALEILHLAATDPSPAVQAWAFRYLKAYAYRDFSADYDAYLAWHSAVADRPLGDVLVESAHALALRLAGLRGEELVREMRRISPLDLRPGAVAGVDLASVLREDGLLDSLRDALAGGEPALAVTSLSWLDALEPPEAWLRLAVLPLLSLGELSGEAFEAEGGEAVFAAACAALGHEGNAWAIEPLLDAFLAAPPDRRPALAPPLRALARIADPRAIPPLIGAIVADPPSSEVIATAALAQLTGVPPDPSHDAAFWLEWWERNQGRMPAEIRGASIPRVFPAPPAIHPR